jgi:hypothetical protein
LITLSDEVTSGAGGFTFSDSLGSWKVAGPRKLTARFLNLNFDISGPPAFSGTAVVDYVYQLSENFRTIAASSQGKIVQPQLGPGHHVRLQLPERLSLPAHAGSLTWRAYPL